MENAMEFHTLTIDELENLRAKLIDWEVPDHTPCGYCGSKCCIGNCEEFESPYEPEMEE